MEVYASLQAFLVMGVNKEWGGLDPNWTTGIQDYRGPIGITVGA